MRYDLLVQSFTFVYTGDNFQKKKTFLVSETDLANIVFSMCKNPMNFRPKIVLSQNLVTGRCAVCTGTCTAVTVFHHVLHGESNLVNSFDKWYISIVSCWRVETHKFSYGCAIA